jgi:flagellar biosynthesis chaperone FliJ
VSLPAAIGPSALTAESWALNLQTEIANLENALKEQRNLLSRLDGEFQNGRIERNRFEEMGQSASDLIAEIEKNLAERRQRLPKDTTENLSGERNM